MVTEYRVQSASEKLKVVLRLENRTWGRKSLKGMRNRLLKTFIRRHYVILTSIRILYRVQTLTSHNTEESENSPESPPLGEIKRMRKQCPLLRNIRESVDSLCRDGANAQYMQYLSKSRIYMQYLSKSRITSPQIR